MQPTFDEQPHERWLSPTLKPAKLKLQYIFKRLRTKIYDKRKEKGNEIYEGDPYMEGGLLNMVIVLGLFGSHRSTATLLIEISNVRVLTGRYGWHNLAEITWPKFCSFPRSQLRG